MRNSRLFFLIPILLLIVASATLAGVPSQELLAAARKSDLAAATAALTAGADVNAKTEYGATALMYSADRGSVEIVKLLLAHKADVNAKDTFYKGSALMNAAGNNHAAVVQLLLEAGAEGAEELLQQAAAQGPLDVVQAILASKRAGPAALGSALAVARMADQAAIVAALEGTGAKEPEVAPLVAVKPEVLQSYAGTYKSEEIGMEIVFVQADGKLKGTVTGQPAVTYTPKDQTTFEGVEVPGVKVVFKTVEGKVPSLTIEQGGRSFVFQRAEEKPAVPPAAPVVEEKGKAPVAAAPAAPAAPQGPIKVKNWPSFRGDHATGVADGQAPPTIWDAGAGSNIAWKTEIPGLAHSGPVVWGDRVFVTTAVSSAKDVPFKAGLYGDVASVDTEPAHQWKVYALDRRTGKVLWERVAHEGVPKAKRHAKASHANSTPATDGKHVVAMFGSEGLYCYDFEGKLLWKKDLGLLDAGFFFDPDDQWGFGSSPILYKDLVIVQCDVQGRSFIAAFSAQDGREVWRTLRDEVSSWGSPTVHEGPARAELLTNGTKAARGYDPLTGKELWKLAGNAEITVPTPFVAHDLAYVTSGYAPIQPIYAIRLGAQGDITLQGDAEKSDSIAWSKKRGGPYMPTPIVYGNHLYTVGNNGVLVCYDAKTGEQIYKGRVAGDKSAAFTASPVAADGKLYFTSEEGDVYVVKAGPEYELLATNPVGEVCMATPAIAGGMVLIRGQHHLFAAGR